MSTATSTLAPEPKSLLRRHPWIVFAVVGVVILTLMRFACGSGRELGKLVPIGTVPSFELLDHKGKAFGSNELDGKPWVASFFFSSCRRECPAIMQANAKVQAGLQKKGVADKVAIVSFSVDPEYDTPAVLNDYALNYPIDGINWRLLTGDRKTLERVIVGDTKKADDGQVLQSGFATAWGQRTEGGGLISIAHAHHLILVDGQGRIRFYFDAYKDEDIDNLVLHAAELTKPGAE